MRKTRSTPIVPVLMTLLASCAAPSFGGDGVTPRGDPDVITREEMDENSAGTAYALVQTLRPQPYQGSVILLYYRSKIGNFFKRFICMAITTQYFTFIYFFFDCIQTSIMHPPGY